jgi:hypothetical protein
MEGFASMVWSKFTVPCSTTSYVGVSFRKIQKRYEWVSVLLSFIFGDLPSQTRRWMGVMQCMPVILATLDQNEYKDSALLLYMCVICMRMGDTHPVGRHQNIWDFGSCMPLAHFHSIQVPSSLSSRYLQEVVVDGKDKHVHVKVMS